MSDSSLLTQKDVAAAAGVSTCIVSRALTGKPGVSERTRKRVCAVAEELGYHASTAASLLARQRHRPRAAIRQPVVGIPTYEDGLNPMLADLCRELGIDGRPLPAGKPLNTRELVARGLHGLLLHAHGIQAGHPMMAGFDPSPFAVVKLSRGCPELPCDLVRLDAFDFMWTTLERVFRHGYRRIAVVTHASASPRDDAARLGAILAFREQHRARGFHCVWRHAGKEARISDDTLAWLQQEAPEAVVVSLLTMAMDLRHTGLRFPEDLACAVVLISTNDQKDPFTRLLAGCDRSYAEERRQGLVMLLERIQQNHRGLPAFPRESVIEPVWTDGSSLPPRGG